MNADPSPDQQRRAPFWLLVAITVILSGWALRATAAFMVPVVFSVFLAVLVAPLDRWITERVPDKVDWLGHSVAMGAILVAQLIVVGMIWIAAEQVFERFDMAEARGSLLSQLGSESGGESGSQPSGESGDRSRGSAPDVEEGSEGTASGTAAGAGGGDSAGSASKKQTSGSGGILAQFSRLLSGLSSTVAGRLRDWASGMAMTISSAASTMLGSGVLVFFLTLIMLTEGAKWRRKIATALVASASDKAMDSIDIIADRLFRYLVARTILGVITAALYVAWLWIFGVDLLVVWALLAFLLNYTPTLGSLIAGVLPVIYAFVQKDVGTAIAIGAGIFLIEQVMGNYVDPRVQGRQVSLSPLVILITLLFWGWIWGLAGAVLAVPITIAMMIICAHVGPLRPFALMLSNATDMDGLDRQARALGE